MNLDFEQGPIRPPSEARSLLIRVTRNCPWNKCEFCPVYKRSKFSLRTVDEVRKDIDAARDIVASIKQYSWQKGMGGQISGELIEELFQRGSYPPGFQSVAAWLYYGGKSAFLQDANTLIMKTPELVQIVSYLKEAFPQLERITSYARSQTLARKTVEELKELKKAGLNRIHVGLESGSDNVLKYVRKGCTAEQHIKGGRNVKEAGIELSEYVMPGLGGRRWSTEHALETARVLNAIDADFIRIRSLSIPKVAPLYEKWESGDFERLNDEEIVKELRLFIENLDGINSMVISDHILNLLEELNGKLPEDKEDMLAVIDEFLDMPSDERVKYIIGRRAGLLRSVSELSNPGLRQRVETILDRIKADAEDVDVQMLVNAMLERYI
jgi:radical SAM superfamily enzyme YgiQ (UPF0313 family)